MKVINGDYLTAPIERVGRGSAAVPDGAFELVNLRDAQSAGNTIPWARSLDRLAEMVEATRSDGPA
jgi:hypothetical protein